MTRTNKTRRVWTAALIVALIAPAAFAASVRPMSLEEMVQASDEIIVGRVVSSETRWRGRLIVTVSQVDVQESLKGQGSGRIEVTRLGGTATHPVTGLSITMEASTFVGLETGEDVLLFISRDASGVGQLVGAQQGRMSIRENPRTKRQEVPIGPKRLEVLRGQGRDSVRATTLTLDELRDEIRSYVRPAGVDIDRGGVRP